MIFNFLFMVCSNFILKNNRGTNTALHMTFGTNKEMKLDKPVFGGGGYDQRHNATIKSVSAEFQLLNKIRQHHFNMRLLKYLNHSYMKTLPLELVKDDLHKIGFSSELDTIVPNITTAGLFSDWDSSCDF